MAAVSSLTSAPENLLCIGDPDTACREIAERLGLQLRAIDEPECEPGSLCLFWNHGILSLGRFGVREHPVAVDFIKALSRRRQGPELLIKAIGGSCPSVVDATAGLGRDSAVMLSKGCKVTMLEENPVVAAMLGNALARLNVDPVYSSYGENIGLLHQRAEEILPALAVRGDADVIYLDPMFAESGKSALAKKDMQLFHSLVGRGDDGSGLLELALQCAEYRVVVKRALKAPVLGGRDPGFTIKGKAVRFDVYPIKSFAKG